MWAVGKGTVGSPVFPRAHCLHSQGRLYLSTEDPSKGPTRVSVWQQTFTGAELETPTTHDL